MEKEDILLYFWTKYQGNCKDFWQALKKQESIDYSYLENIKLELKNKGINYLTYMDSLYPKEMLFYKFSQIVIFYKGNINLLTKTKITLTGDIYDGEVEFFFENQLSKFKDFVIVNPDFKGVDQKINDLTTHHNIKSIYILPCGINDKYYKINKISEGDNLVLSIYPVNTHPKYYRFLEKNHLISIFSDELILGKIRYKSKILNLVSQFVDKGKSVSILETADPSVYNSYLILDGATPLDYGIE
ncbi:putative Rossmann fold nucleotide-binding protein DprA/Smf involved in DNA uptake [Mycoplasma testudineum]|uniref:Putative Rossmann fold nucleotide-binding protein DprA/Smf involved in DNA uptake n=1 Tax=Mycoplasma testudineum TaxID=244584 RepID=A0A4R6IHH8_9MOLU|nr:DNA-processing protein DprA [Mycoplasma testudineum]OYD27017.1 hypothetical protein CG473_01630 [Mycoplasma testudineum]TDO20565.1 putative Rossmann fold nucleotide-binding protein DprA/Smf involved in DNA uptake [Mycoplasma testudineum]